MKISKESLGSEVQGLNGLKQKSSTRLGKKEGMEAPASNLEKSSSVQVNLSDRAKELQRVKDLIKESDDVNEAKVAQLQKMIDAGEYKVDASKVADRLVEEHLKFPS